MGKKEEPDKLPQRDRTKAAEKMAERRKRDQQTGWEVGDHTKRPHHPDGWGGDRSEPGR